MREDGIKKLIKFWSARRFKKTEHIHTDDTKAFEKMRKPYETTRETFAPEKKSYFHLSLSPVPYMGNLRSADTDIFLLMLNPFAEFADYFTNANLEFFDALDRTRRQNFKKGETTCLALNPDYCGSSWFCYYEHLLKPTIAEYAKAASMNYWDALKKLSNRLAILELVPYYSAGGSRIRKRFLENLKSAERAKEAARDLQARAQNGVATVIIPWASDRWGLKSAKGITDLEGRTKGGFLRAQEKILERLKSNP